MESLEAQFIGKLIAWIVFTLPACIIIAKKKRGAGYYFLAILFPFLGLIVALCLKKYNPYEKALSERKNATSNFDITKDNHK